MNGVAIGIVVSFALYIVVGMIAGKKVASTEDYYVSGRNANTLLLTGTLIASMISTNMYMGDGGFSYSGWTIPIIGLMLGVSIGQCLGPVFFGKYIRRSGALTVSVYFGERFDSRKVQIAVGIVTLLAVFSYLLAATQGINLILSTITGLDYKVCLVLTWIVYTSFTVYSGSKGVVITDTIMFMFFFIISLIVIPFVVNAAVGEMSLSEMVRQLAVFEQKPGIISYHGLLSDDWLQTPFDGVAWTVTIAIAWFFAISVSPWQAGRHLMAKNEHTSLRTGAIGMVLLFFVVLLVYFVAAAVNLINPDIVPDSEVFIWVSYEVLPSILGILLMTGIMSAGLSSASTFLSLIGFAITKDILNIKDVGKKTVNLSRLVMLGAGIVILFIGLFVPENIFWITTFSGTVIAAALAFPGLMSVWSKTITKEGAFWGIIVGLVGNVGTKFATSVGMMTLPVWLDPFFIGFAGCIIVTLIISKFTQVTDSEKSYREKLFIVPEGEKDPAEVKRTLLYAKVTMAIGIVIIVAMIALYAIPYNAAISA